MSGESPPRESEKNSRLNYTLNADSFAAGLWETKTI